MNLRTTRKAFAASLLAAMLVTPALANEGTVPRGVPRLDHLFVIVNTDNPSSPNVCPITGEGTDAATPAVDCSNEVQCAPGSNSGENNIDGVMSIAAAANISGKTIADQLVAAGLSWKSYQESLPASGADGVNFSDGLFTDSSNIPGVIPGEAQSLIKLYAAKHNPFVYFRSIQEGARPGLRLDRVVGFQGPHGLYEDLASGR